MGAPLRFRVSLIGFGDLGDREPSPSGIVLEIEWLTEPSSVKRVPLSREDFDVYGSALIAAKQAGDVYWLNLNGPDVSPLPALLRAVKAGQTYYP